MMEKFRGNKGPLFWVGYGIVVILLLVVCAVLWRYEKFDVKYEKTESQKKREEQDVAYEKARDAQEASLPGIVCWGDGLTESGWADEFDILVSQNVAGVVNEQLRVHFYGKVPVEIPVINMGVKGETSRQTMARSGADPYIIAADFVIPAEKSSVEVKFSFSDGSASPTIRFGENGMETVTIAGVEGEVGPLRDSSSKLIGYLFQRLEVGEAVEVKAGTPIETPASVEYKNYIPVIHIGTNGGYDDNPQELVAQINRIRERAEAPGDKYIVVGIHLGNAAERAQLEAVMTEAFGSNYVNLRASLSSESFLAPRMELTSVDYASIAAGSVPKRLLLDSGYFTSEGYQMVAQLIYDRMNELGYFNELMDSIKEVKTESEVE